MLLVYKNTVIKKIWLFLLDPHYHSSSLSCCVVSLKRGQRSLRPILRHRPVIYCLSGVYEKAPPPSPWWPSELPVRKSSDFSEFTRILRNFYSMKGLLGIPQTAHFKGQACDLWSRGRVNKALWEPMRNKNVSFKHLCNTNLLFVSLLCWICSFLTATICKAMTAV